jgi:hypothetical protein
MAWKILKASLAILSVSEQEIIEGKKRTKVLVHPNSQYKNFELESLPEIAVLDQNLKGTTLKLVPSA